MAYTSDYSYGSGYASSYSGNYYGYQVGVIFAILIAGLLLLAICAAVIYFGCVRVMRRSEKQRRSGSVSTRASALSTRARAWQPPTTASYTQFSSEKPPLPYEPPGSGYSPDQETPILQSSMHTQAAYIPPPPTYAVRPASLQQQQQHLPLEKTFSRPHELEDAYPRQVVTIAERPYGSAVAATPSRMYTRQDKPSSSSSAWQETVVTRSTVPEQQQQRIVSQSVTFHTSSV